MIRIVIILISILFPFAIFPDTLDFEKMSRSDAHELFKQADAYRDRHKEDTAMVYYLYAISACGREDSKESSRICAESYNELGKCYFNQGYYSKAFDAFSNALKISEQQGFTNLLSRIYNNIGSIYATWNDVETGIHYFKRGLDVIGNNPDEKVYTNLLINIIGTQCRIGNSKAAWEAYDKLLKYSGKDSLIQYYCFANRGLILISENKGDEAKPFLIKAARYAEDNNLDQLYAGYAYSTLADLYVNSKTDSAILFYRKAMSKEIPAFMRRSLLKSMAALYQNINPQLANQYEHNYLTLSDSLFDENEINRNKGAQFVYEMEKNYRDMERLHAEKAAQAAHIRQQRRAIFIICGITTIIIILIVMIIRRSIKLKVAYRDLFHHNKEIINSEARSRAIQKNLEDEIKSLRLKLSEVESQTAEYDNITSEADNKTSDKEQNDNSISVSRQQSCDRLTESQKQAILTAITNIVEKREEIFNCDFSIEMLADLTGYNSKYLSKVIKESTECNFRAWINSIRIREAQLRLLDVVNYGNYTIRAIAQSVGYKSHANFILLFKKETGLSPSAFQKMALHDSNKIINEEP